MKKETSLIHRMILFGHEISQTKRSAVLYAAQLIVTVLSVKMAGVSDIHVSEYNRRGGLFRMKIIDQSHEILSWPVQALEMIERAGRTCYKSEDKIGCSIPEEHQGPENCPDMNWDFSCASECKHHSSRKFVKMLQNRGHYAMIEFADLTVKFITNRGVTHELVRHRMCSFAQESTRYVKYDVEMEFIRPIWCNAIIIGKYPQYCGLNHSEVIFIRSCMNAEFDYRALLQKGWRSEQAREVLPNSLKTEIVVKANLREWHHILTLRTSKAAHPQMRALMLPLLKELKEKIPVIFDGIQE